MTRQNKGVFCPVGASTCLTSIVCFWFQLIQVNWDLTALNEFISNSQHLFNVYHVAELLLMQILHLESPENA